MALIYSDPEKLHAALTDDGFPVISVSSDGKFSFDRELTKTEKTSFDAFITSWDGSPTTEEQRLKTYQEAGITGERLIFALWKELKKGDGTDAVALQAIMDDIDSQIN